MKILVTGGTGFIGSHTVVELLAAGYEVQIIDNLCNSSCDVVDRIELISGVKPVFYRMDLLDSNALEQLFKENRFDAVVHFAGLKAVGESVDRPLKYYNNNVAGSLNLFKMMQDYGVNKLVFSSSATVYGESNIPPFNETMPTAPINPYGRTKLMIEEIIADWAAAWHSLRAVLLRYFNPVGAHESGLIGEDPLGIPNNLFPYINRVATGAYHELKVFGSDYPTRDGTGIRDYIHVSDLSMGHLSALKWTETNPGCEVFNLGSGCGYSVLEVLQTYEEINAVKLKNSFAPRRAGDAAVSFADVSKANTLLGWRTSLGLDQMCKSSYQFAAKRSTGV